MAVSFQSTTISHVPSLLGTHLKLFQMSPSFVRQIPVRTCLQLLNCIRHTWLPVISRLTIKSRGPHRKGPSTHFRVLSWPIVALHQKWWSCTLSCQDNLSPAENALASVKLQAGLTSSKIGQICNVLNVRRVVNLDASETSLQL